MLIQKSILSHYNTPFDSQIKPTKKGIPKYSLGLFGI